MRAPRDPEAKLGRGPIDKVPVVGIKDRDSAEVRAEVVHRVNGETLQGFVRANTEPGATVYTDEAAAYRGLARDFDHEAVNHTSEYVREDRRTRTAWTFGRCSSGRMTTFHKISPKHLQRYVSEFAGKHNHRESPRPDAGPRSPASLAGTCSPRPVRGQRAFVRVRGRKGTTRRNRARASVSGVAPARSTFGSSFGRYFITAFPRRHYGFV